MSRTPSGFQYSSYQKYIKNAKTLKYQLAKKQLPCLFIYDSIDDIAPQADPREILSCLHVEPDSVANTVTAAATTVSKYQRQSTTYYINRTKRISCVNLLNRTTQFLPVILFNCIC